MPGARIVPIRIALWGTFDVDNYGDHLFPRVAIHELRRRLPNAVVEPYSPYGRLHPTGLDDGRAAEPLGPWSPERAGELAALYDLVAIGGGELIHLNDPLLAAVYDTTPDELARMAPSRWFVEALGPELEARCPVVWHGVGVPWAAGEEEARRLRGALAGRSYIAVRDRFSARRLSDAGVEGPVEVVPDSALLVDRIMPPAALGVRLGALRDRGDYPGPSSPVLVVQGCDLMVPHVAAVAAAVAHWRAVRPDGEVVVIETGRCRGDGVFADALQLVLGQGLRAWRLPTGVAVEDLAAAIVGADLFLGSSLHGAITALAYGRPFVLLNLMGESKLDGFGDLTGLGRSVLHSAGEVPEGLDAALAAGPAPRALLAGLQHRIDRHFDRLAQMAAARAATAPARPPRLPARVLQRFTKR